MKTSEAIGDLSAALCKAQAKLTHAKKDSLNPHFKSRYADLQSVTEAARPVLAENGLAVVHGCESGDGKTVTVTCRLLHSSGQWIETSLALQPTKPDPPGIGSAITYGRRYTLASIVGIATEDDDGNAASVPQNAPPAQRAAPVNGAQKSDAAKMLTVKVQRWTGLPMEEIGGVMRKIKGKCGITNTASTDADVALMDKWVSDKIKEGGDALVHIG